MKALALINDRAGTVAKAGEDAMQERLSELIAAAGWAADFETGDADTLVAAARRAEKYDAVVCAGGDGTQAAVAGALSGREIALLPLPCGTVNLLCRDLGLSMDISEALAAGLAARPAKIDVGLVKGDEIGARTFLNNIVFGAYADLAEARESMRKVESLDDVAFAVVEAVDAVVNAEPSTYKILIDGAERKFRTTTLVVSNGPFSGASDFIPRRERLDAGALAVYLAEAEGGGGFTKRLLDFLSGAAEESQKVELVACGRCCVSVDGGPTPYAIDGDPLETLAPLVMSVRPKALTVLAPGFSKGA